MVATIICIAGGIATGKTTLAQALVERLPNSSVRSFGDVVRQYARDQGLPLDRPTLQRAGLQLIAEGWPTFVGRLVADVPDDAARLIIDGVRHQQAVDDLRRQHPAAELHVVFLAIDSRTQQGRLLDRGELLASLDHDVESDLPRLRESALVIDATQPAADVADRVLAVLGLAVTHTQAGRADSAEGTEQP